MSARIDVLASLRQIADGEGDVELLAMRVHDAVAELIVDVSPLIASLRPLITEDNAMTQQAVMVRRAADALARVQANSHGAGVDRG